MLLASGRVTEAEEKWIDDFIERCEELETEARAKKALQRARN